MAYVALSLHDTRPRSSTISSSTSTQQTGWYPLSSPRFELKICLAWPSGALVNPKRSITATALFSPRHALVRHCVSLRHSSVTLNPAKSIFPHHSNSRHRHHLLLALRLAGPFPTESTHFVSMNELTSPRARRASLENFDAMRRITADHHRYVLIPFSVPQKPRSTLISGTSDFRVVGGTTF